MTEKKYHGVIIPAVTPLTFDFKLDEAGVEKMFDNFYKHQVHPFILGTTGESVSLTHQVKKDYLKAVYKNKKADTFLYAGISSNCLQESIDFANECADAGVDAVAATLPAYYALTESQMKTYFEQLANAIKVPLIIYNIPATTHMSIPLPLIDELSHHENIVGAKDSERSEERLDESIRLWKDRKDFSHFLGWAVKSAYALINGSDGLIPSTGNLIPSIYTEMEKAFVAGDEAKTHEMQRLSDVFGDVYQGGRTLGESLWALKVLMNDAKLCQSFVMPPLQEKSKEEEIKLLETYREILHKENFATS
ncbi:MAG TPA: dihydrodipicolinate synthase family protein [Pelobium sp.]|nr:dihydrodipicolinate synthase family protein [Pelobium sp.]